MSQDDTPEDHAATLERLAGMFSGLVPHNQALGLKLIDFDRAGVAVMQLPYKPELVGNPDTGVLHGGAITSLIDATSGASVFLKIWSPMPIATLDLRIDYLRPAEPQRDVICKATCYRLTKNVAFVRAVAHQGQEDDPVASSASTFMLSTRGVFAKIQEAT
ncbi:MAG: hotdog domain-containing protein [Myxococcota bacterium]